MQKISVELNFPFTTPSNYTYDTDKIEVSGGVGKLKLIDDTGKTFNQPFTSDSGFTYDSNKTEFSGGLLQQKDKAPTNSTCWATYTSNINLNYGNGILTGTPTGGAAVSGGKLDLANSDLRYVDYDADLNADSQQTGTIKFKVTPNYTGNPANDMYLFAITKQASSRVNELSFYHKTSGTLSLRIYNSSGILAGESTFVSWSPTSGVEYEFEVNYDLTSGANRFFINGIQQGITSTVTTTRDALIGLMRIGSSYNAGFSSNFKIDDLIIFSTVQHTSNYTPGYTLAENRYVEDLITYPVFTYPGVGYIQAFTNIVATQTGINKFNVNGQYYSGVWTSSDDSYAQMNTIAEILAQITTLPISDTVTIKMRNLDTNTQMNINDLTLTYTGQIYPIDDPTIEGNSSWRNEALEGFTETSTKVGSDEIKYVLKKGSDYYYWDGAAWSVSDETYSQANTAAEIETNKATFTTIGVTTKFKAFLHSNDGSTTPEIDNLQILYNFAGESGDTLNLCIVWGFTKDIQGNINTDPITIYPTIRIIEYKANTQLLPDKIIVTPDSTGYWEAELIITEDGNMDPIPQYVFEIDGTSYKKSIPNQESINFNDL